MISRNCRLLTWMLRSDGDSGPPPGSAASRKPPSLDMPDFFFGRAISTTFNCFRSVATGIRRLAAPRLDQPEVPVLLNGIEPADPPTESD